MGKILVIEFLLAQKWFRLEKLNFQSESTG